MNTIFNNSLLALIFNDSVKVSKVNDILLFLLSSSQILIESFIASPILTISKLSLLLGCKYLNEYDI